MPIARIATIGQPDKWICLDCGALYAHAVFVCSSRECQARVWARITGRAGVNLGDGYAMDSDISHIKKGVKFCFYCLREYDGKSQACAGCGGTRFRTMENQNE